MPKTTVRVRPPRRAQVAGSDVVAMTATLGAVAAGAALFEVALIPGLVIGGVAVLAPSVLPGLARGARAAFARAPRRAGAEGRQLAPIAIPARFEIKQAVVKTITFRVIVTTLDFSTNYIVLGNFATAAGLSGFTLAVGPLFYFLHETAWNYYGAGMAPDARVPIRIPFRTNAEDFTISRALAKTITFRTVATMMDFTVNYVVVGDFATAAGLSAFGFFIGPFVYLGHEKAWEYYGARQAPAPDGQPALAV